MKSTPPDPRDPIFSEKSSHSTVGHSQVKPARTNPKSAAAQSWRYPHLSIFSEKNLSRVESDSWKMSCLVPVAAGSRVFLREKASFLMQLPPFTWGRRGVLKPHTLVIISLRNSSAV